MSYSKCIETELRRFYNLLDELYDFKYNMEEFGHVSTYKEDETKAKVLIDEAVVKMEDVVEIIDIIRGHVVNCYGN